MQTIVIKSKSRSNSDLLIALAQKLGEKTTIITDKFLEDALFASQIEEGIGGGLLNEKEKKSFLKELGIKAKK